MAKYNEKELADTSKFLSFVLRHKPEAIGIVLDREGWADIDKLILCAQKAGKRLTRALLDTVVATSDKVIFAAYQTSGSAIITNSFPSGVAVFAFLGTSVIVPLAVILVFKFVGANILRVWLNFEERRNPTQGAQA